MDAELKDRLQAALGSGYRVEAELGGGGMSRVFVAEEVELGRKVVVKVLPPEMAAGVNAERFRREIQLAAQLHGLALELVGVHAVEELAKLAEPARHRTPFPRHGRPQRCCSAACAIMQPL